jgi:hypothetical protein
MSSELESTVGDTGVDGTGSMGTCDTCLLAAHLVPDVVVRAVYARCSEAAEHLLM